jgi:hypothetical protein
MPHDAAATVTISQMNRYEFRISDGPLALKFFRWPTATPDGGTVAFQAVGPVGTGRRGRGFWHRDRYAF